jgi:hypothetical protein
MDGQQHGTCAAALLCFVFCHGKGSATKTVASQAFRQKNWSTCRRPRAVRPSSLPLLTWSADREPRWQAGADPDNPPALSGIRQIPAVGTKITP